jgi:hypothetical protein
MWQLVGLGRVQRSQRKVSMPVFLDLSTISHMQLHVAFGQKKKRNQMKGQQRAAIPSYLLKKRGSEMNMLNKGPL